MKPRSFRSVISVTMLLSFALLVVITASLVVLGFKVVQRQSILADVKWALRGGDARIGMSHLSVNRGWSPFDEPRTREGWLPGFCSGIAAALPPNATAAPPDGALGQLCSTFMAALEKMQAASIAERELDQILAGVGLLETFSDPGSKPSGRRFESREEAVRHLQSSTLAFRGLWLLFVVAATFLMGVLGWILSFKRLKDLADEPYSAPRGTAWKEFPWLLVAWCGTAIILGNLIGFSVVDESTLFRHIRDLWAIHRWIPLVVLGSLLTLISFGYGFDLTSRRRHEAARSRKEAGRIEWSLSLGSSQFSWALVFTVGSLWTMAITVLFSQQIGEPPLTGDDMARLGLFVLAFLSMQFALLVGLWGVTWLLRRRNRVEKRSHYAHRLLILFAPFSVVLLTTAGWHRFVWTSLAPNSPPIDPFFHIGLVPFEGLPVALFAPLVLIATLSDGRSRHLHRPFRDAGRTAFLFLSYVVRSNKVVFLVSFLFSLLILIQWDSSQGKVAEIVVLNIAIAASSLWLVPLVQSLLAYEATCFDAYTFYLRQSFQGLSHHFVVGGYGDFGQRVVQGIVRKAAFHDPRGLRTLFDGVDLLMPDGTLEKLWTGVVAIDRNPERFHYITTLENGLRCGVAYVTTSAEPGTTAILVPAVVGDVAHREVGTTVALPHATYFACLVRDTEAPQMLLQGLARMTQESKELNGRNPPPLTVLAASNQSQFDSLQREVHEYDLRAHVIYPSYLESVHFAGRIYALYKKHVSLTGQVPRILLVGRGKHLALSLDAITRFLTSDEIRRFREEHRVSSRIAILTDHGAIEQMGQPFRRLRTDGMPPVVDRKLFGLKVSGLWNNPVEDWCRMCHVPRVDVELPVLFHSPLDWEPMVKTLRSFQPDIVALIDYEYVHQHATLGNVLAAIRRTTPHPSSLGAHPRENTWLPVPQVVVCRESGPGGSMRRQVNQMLLEHARFARETTEQNFKDDPQVLTDRREYLSTFPALPSLEEIGRCATPEHIDRAVRDAVVDVLDECVSRVLALADTRLPKGRRPDTTFELNFCLPEAVGAMARFWSLALLGRRSETADGRDPYRNRLLLSSIHVEEDALSMEPERSSSRFVGKSLAYLPELDDCGHGLTSPFVGSRVRVARHVLTSGDGRELEHAETTLRTNLDRVHDENTKWKERKKGDVDASERRDMRRRYWWRACPANQYCGLDALASLRQLQPDTPHSRMFDRMFWLKLSAVRPTTPFAYIEFHGLNVPGKAAEALNSMLLRVLRPVESSAAKQRGNVTFVSDYQCSSERHSRVLMLARFNPLDTWDGADSLDDGGLEDLVIRPITGAEAWDRYAAHLASFLNRFPAGPWRIEKEPGRIHLLRHVSPGSGSTPDGTAARMP